MKKLKHIKDKAIELRQNGLSLEQIVKNLGMAKGTVYYWVKDIPLQRDKTPPNIQKMNKARKEKLEIEYKKAYAEGLEDYVKNCDNKHFRDLILVFLTEGYRKSKNTVEVINTNPLMIKMCQTILQKFAPDVKYQVHYHEDRTLNDILDFWSVYLGIDRNSIRTQIKKGNLSKRSEACNFGIMHLQVNDYKMRHKMQAWMDCVEAEWTEYTNRREVL